MNGVAPAPHRDDSAWPSGAVPVSLLIVALAGAAGIAVVAADDKPVVAVAALLVGVLVGSALIVVAIRRWLAGRSIPWWLGLAGALFAIAGTVLVSVISNSGAGFALPAGLVAGMMGANVWAVRAARANRPTPSR